MAEQHSDLWRVDEPIEGTEPHEAAFVRMRYHGLDSWEFADLGDGYGTIVFRNPDDGKARSVPSRSGTVWWTPPTREDVYWDAEHTDQQWYETLSAIEQYVRDVWAERHTIGTVVVEVWAGGIRLSRASLGLVGADLGKEEEVARDAIVGWGLLDEALKEARSKALNLSKILSDLDGPIAKALSK